MDGDADEDELGEIDEDAEGEREGLIEDDGEETAIWTPTTSQPPGVPATTQIFNLPSTTARSPISAVPVGSDSLLKR